MPPKQHHFGKYLPRDQCIQIEVMKGRGIHKAPVKVPVQPPFYADLCTLARGSVRSTITDRIQQVFHETAAEINEQGWLAHDFEYELRTRAKAKLRVSYSEERALEFDSTKAGDSGETGEDSHPP